MQNAVAFSNNDVITIAWSYNRKPEGCMGFAVYRLDEQDKETPLPSHAVFPGNKIEPGQTTAQFPIQKFYWKDVYARPIAEKTGKRKFRYKIVPLEGEPGALTPMKTLPHLITNEMAIGPEAAPGLSAYFNRGLISTQRVSRAFKGKPVKGALLTQIADQNSALRASLSGDMVEALTEFLARANDGGTIYAALYELSDEQLIQSLTGLGAKLKIVLSNSGADDEDPGDTTGDNQTGPTPRERVGATAAVEFNRMMPTGHIGHNKFLVYEDANKQPVAVLFGSTNWTATGLCAQTNNTVVIEDSALAKRYIDYWNALAADTKAAGDESKNLQGAKLRTSNAKSKSLQLNDATRLDSWFSPNTPHQRSSSPKNEAQPPDMKAVKDLIDKAEHAILFLAFNPGTPSIANWAADALRAKKDLFVRGCVTNKGTAENFFYELKGMTPPKKEKGDKTPPKEDPRVIGAEAFDGSVIPEGWQKEILAAGFAIIHDKILVIDPFSDKCVVVTGSHNLGHRASYNNDENLAIIQGNRKLAVAYATHVLDVYDHFSWRFNVKRLGKQGADQSLSVKPDDWMDKYFDAAGNIKTAQLKFWMQATAPDRPSAARAGRKPKVAAAGAGRR